MNLLEMSLSTSVFIVVIALIRRFFLNRLPKRALLVLWWIALFRLLVPVSIPSSFSIYTLFQGEADRGEVTVLHGQMILSDADVGGVSGSRTEAEQGQPEGVIKAGTDNAAAGQMGLSDVSPGAMKEGGLRIGWSLGTLVLAVFFLTSYIRCFREFRTSFPAENDFPAKWLAFHRLLRPVSIRISGMINTPLTYGILRPVILMPEDTDWEEEEKLCHVLEHEFVHIKRLDSLAKLIMTAALCIHWFNPIVWRMYLLCNRDLELSCDEAALQRLGVEQRAAYARTLISMEEKRVAPVPLFNTFGKSAANQMEERITAVMKTRKHTFVTIFMTSLLVVVTAVVFATSARAAVKPAQADWERGFTKEETEMLHALWFEDYESMTISEFRGKSQSMTDTKEYLKVIERFSQQQEKTPASWQSDAPLSLRDFADYFYNIYEPLNADKWQTREFGDFVCQDFSTGEHENYPVVPLEYFLFMTILEPEELTVGEYFEARRGVYEDLDRFWQERTVQELTDEAFMNRAIESKIKEITERRGSKALKLSIDYFYNPIDLQNVSEEESSGTGEETRYGNKQDPRRWPMGTRQDYDSLLALMNQDGIPYGEMAVADFNRSLLEWAEEDYERAERIGEDAVLSDYQVSLSEEERRFVELTMRLSGGENAQLVRGIYNGTQPEDPWWGGRSLYKTAFDGQAFCTLYYQFPYHIQDDGRITVSERDERLEKMEQEIFELFQSLEFEELLTLEKEDIVKRLELLAESLSDEKLTVYIAEDQIGFEHVDGAEYDILLNDRDSSGITVDAALLSYDGTDNMYLKEMITNRTQKTISRVEYCMLAYGEDGSPLKIRWNFLDSSASESYEYFTWSDGEILPGDTRSLPGGWSVYDSTSTYGLEPPAEEYKVKYVLLGIRQIEFGDGSIWLDPDFEEWLADHKGREVDSESLRGYYPFDREISE